MSLTLLCACLVMPKDDYRVVWSDEFNKPGPPDLSQWTPEIGFVRNKEAQWYRLENAQIKSGFLEIEARRERLKNPNFSSEAGSDWKRSREYAEYTSSSLVTKQSWLYGRFEIRAKIDIRDGMWPAFWTLGTAREWPSNGEIDIMEFYRGKVLANFAWGTEKRFTAKWDDSATPVEDLAKLAGLKSAAEWADKFHTWRLDWDAEAMSIYLDDRLMNSVKLSETFNTSIDKANPFREPHQIILNLAIGGDNGGDPSKTEFPAKFLVDWVRVSQKVKS